MQAVLWCPRTSPRSVLLLVLLLAAAIVLSDAAAQEKTLPSARQEATPVPRVLPGQWELTPLVRVGDAAPDTGGRVEEFGDWFWLDSGVLVFWGRFGPKESAIYSWKDGRLQLVVPEGNNVQPAHAEGVTEKLEIYRITRGRWQTILHPGRRVLYMSIHFGALGKTASVYAWDGEVLRKVLARGDTVSLGGVPHRVRYAKVVATGSDGTALIFLETEQKLSGLALHDGTSLVPLMIEQQELPGMPGVRVKSHWIRGMPVAPDVVPGAAFVEAEVTGAPYKSASLRLTPRKAEIMPAPGAPFPRDHFTEGTEQGEKVLLFHREGQVKAVSKWSTLAQLLSLDRGDWSVKGYAELLNRDPRRVAVLARASRPPTPEEEKSGFLVWARPGEILVRVTSTGLLLFDGDRIMSLTEKLPLSATSQLHRTGGDFPGLLLEAKPLSVSGTIYYEPTPGAKTTWWFLDGNSEEIRLEPVPEFQTVDGRRVPLGNVLGWRKPGEAVVQLPDGFYLLTKR